MHNKSIKYFRAFTLVELLVVISTIAMLLSILMPALGKARGQVYRFKCLSTLSQLVLGWQNYSTDNHDFLCSPYTLRDEAPLKNNWVADGNDLSPYSYKDLSKSQKSNYPGMPCGMPGGGIGGSFPPIDPNAPDPNTFDRIGGTEEAIKQGILWPYINNVKIYMCPAGSMHPRSYAMSYTMGGQQKENDSRDGVKPFREYGEIDKPGQRMVFADAYTEHRFLYGPYWPIEMRDGQLKFRLYDKFYGQYMSYWHGNGTNFAFADMHCEYYKYKSRKTILMLEKKSLGNRMSQGFEGQEQNLDPYSEVNIYYENNPDLDIMIQYLKGRKE